MPRYWLEWPPAGRTQPMSEPVEKPKAAALAYFEGARRFGGVGRKHWRLLDEAGRVVAGAAKHGTTPARASERTLEI